MEKKLNRCGDHRKECNTMVECADHTCHLSLYFQAIVKKRKVEPTGVIFIDAVVGLQLRQWKAEAKLHKEGN